MGKEIAGAVRSMRKRPLHHPNTGHVDAQKELALQWDSTNSLSQSRVVENAGVLVTVLAAGKEKRVLCTGFSRRGNRYHTLIRVLRRHGVIPTGARVKALWVDKGFVNVRADPKKECFLAGDRLIVVVEAKARPVIRKLSRAGEAKDKAECSNIRLGAEKEIEIISIH